MEFGFFNTPDGLKIHTVKWTTDNPKAAVIIVHGIAEHSGRYVHVAEHLTRHGINVYSLDHRTHGRSEGEPRTHFDSFDKPVEDLKQYFDIVRAAIPDLPIFIYGHSMGALISTLFVLEYQELLAGFISSGTPLNLDKAAPAPVVAIGQLAAKIGPRMRALTVSPTGISSIAAEVERYLQDPYNDTQAMRLGIVARMIQRAKEAREQVQRITIPLLIFHGSKDTITPPSGSQLLYDRAASTDKMLKFYEGMHHETHNDKSRDEVLASVARWITERVR